MTETVILYRSKYGATRRYAQWLQEALGCALLENKNLRAAQLAPYRTVILGGGVYAGGIAGLDLLRKNWPALQGKCLRIFAVGASPYDEKALRALQPKAPLEEVPLFYLRGAWDPAAMSWGDRTLCGFLQKAVAKQDPAQDEPWMAALREAGNAPCDWTDRAALAPLLASLPEGPLGPG